MAENHKKTYTADFVLLLISGGVPFGWQMSGLLPSIVAACICWGITLFVTLHIIWKWTGKWNLLLRLIILITIPATIIYVSWNPVKKQYSLQHRPELPKFSQWYIKITNVEFTHLQPANLVIAPQLSFRITLNVDGQLYSYPSEFVYIKTNSIPVETFPVTGQPPFKIMFGGMLVIDSDLTTFRPLSGSVKEQISATTNETAEISVNNSTATLLDVSKLTVHYDIYGSNKSVTKTLDRTE